MKRDKYGIIVQDDPNDPKYEDGGDSCNRTGIMALCGYEFDRHNCVLFITNNLEVVRHPFQFDWNDPKSTSRDAIVAFFAPSAVSQQPSALQYASNWFINKDFLDPAVRLYLYKCAKTQAPLHIRVLGPIFMMAGVLWNCFVKPDHEMNQFVCMALALEGPYLKLLVKYHPDLYKNITDYWSGWRNQAEIGEALINKIKSRF